jgi:SAM-dependent methyltransferase
MKKAFMSWKGATCSIRNLKKKEQIKMPTRKADERLFAASIAIVLAVASVYAQEQKSKDVPYVATPQIVVDKMLEVAAVTKDDIVYDLGSGDGRIVITAAKKYGARGVGVDIDAERVKEANANAVQAGVADRVKFLEQDLFKTDLKEASVVTLYLLPEVNLRLRPKLWRELRPGTRVVSHAFDMGDWKPEQTVQVEGRTIYYWIIPKNSTPTN